MGRGLREDLVRAGIDTAGMFDHDGDLRVAAAVEIFDGGPEEVDAEPAHASAHPDARCLVVDRLAVGPVTQCVVGALTCGRGAHRSASLSGPAPWWSRHEQL